MPRIPYFRTWTREIPRGFIFSFWGVSNYINQALCVYAHYHRCDYTTTVLYVLRNTTSILYNATIHGYADGIHNKRRNSERYIYIQHKTRRCYVHRHYYNYCIGVEMSTWFCQGSRRGEECASIRSCNPLFEVRLLTPRTYTATVRCTRQSYVDTMVCIWYMYYIHTHISL